MTARRLLGSSAERLFIAVGVGLCGVELCARELVYTKSDWTPNLTGPSFHLGRNGRPTVKKMATALQCLVSACFNLPRQTVRTSEGLDIDVDARSSAARSDLYVRSPPDFVELSKDCAVLASGLTVFPDGASTLDFQDEAVLRALTERLLLKDFGVHVSEGLSPDRLCPAVPNRLAYVAWIEELVHGTDLSLSRGGTNVNEKSDQTERKKRKLEAEKRRILDIGTGACCIYALLGCATNPDWTFVGTDIDAGSLQRARRIVSDPLNAELQLRERITLVERRTDDPLLFFSPSSPADAWPAYHATMCNPPFYASRDEMARSAAEKATPPSAVCTGADVEMTTAGGEVAFVSRIIDESCLEPARSNVVWFTSMVGKHASVAALVTKLVSAGVDNFLVNDLVSGSKTRRWILSWSHLPYHPRLTSTSASRHASAGATTPRSLNDCLRRTFKLTEQHSASSLTETLTALHGDVVEVTQDTVVPDSIRFRAWRDAWTRRARRSKAAVICDTSKPPVLACTCTFRQASAEGERHLDVEWTYGSSRDIFETFVSSVIVRWVNS